MARGRGRGRGRGGGRGTRRGEDDEEEEEQYVPPQRGLGGQQSNVGMLPPSDSDEDEDGSEEGEGSKPKPRGKQAGQPTTAGLMPPSDSDDDEGDDDSESDDDVPEPEYLRPAPKKKVVEERDPEEIRKEMERLELIRKKREADKAKRIAQEGWDRFAPISDTNRPPGYVPSDHPSQQKA